MGIVSLATWAQTISIRGTVTDAKSGQPVSFAEVGICEKSIGTVANDNGAYIFNIPAYLENDTLCASAIGYETFKYSIADLKGKKTFNIRMKTQTSVLNEVVIRDEKETARRFIRKAINHIRKNFPVKPYVLDGYYRDYLKKNNEYISFLEAALSVYDPGYRKSSDETQIAIKQLRHSKDYVKYFDEYIQDYANDSTKKLIHGVSPRVKGNEFSNMVYHNPIRNHDKSVPFVGVFDSFADRNYDFEISYYTQIDGKEVVVISIAPSKNFRFTHVSIEGTLYIRTDNFAIVKFSYAYFVTKRLETKKWFEINEEYREHDGRMYLKYMSFMNYFKLLTTTEIADLSVYREFFVNDIHTGDDAHINKDQMIDLEKPLYQQNASNDPQFWINYNRLLLEQPLKE